MKQCKLFLKTLDTSVKSGTKLRKLGFRKNPHNFLEITTFFNFFKKFLATKVSLYKT